MYKYKEEQSSCHSEEVGKKLRNGEGINSYFLFLKMFYWQATALYGCWKNVVRVRWDKSQELKVWKFISAFVIIAEERFF